MLFWVLVGDGNTRKTSTIRAITGVGRREENWDVEYVPGGNIPTYVEISGLQEQHPNYCSPEEFIRRVEAASRVSGVDRVIFALRDQGVGSRPSAQTYIAAFVARGWKPMGIGLTGASLLGSPLFAQYPGLVTAIHPQVTLTSNIPSNLMARQLRGPWGIA